MTDSALVIEPRLMLQAGREHIRDQHRAGADGRETVAALTRLCDQVIAHIHEQELNSLDPADAAIMREQLSLVAVGGYGRAELAPYSDVDLLFLHAPGAGETVRDTVSRLVRRMWDTGLKLSQSVRTPAESCSFARGDLMARTALVDTRLVAGSQNLFNELASRYGEIRQAGNLGLFIDQILAERAREHQDYYVETVYLLEPNVKKSPGGLRDIQLVRWLAAARYGTSDWGRLREQGWLAPGDYDTLVGGLDVLYQIRNELHFHAGSPQDVLNRDEQVRLAVWLKFPNDEKILAVERFMQHYYRHTSAIHDLMLRFVERIRPRRLAGRAYNRLVRHRIEKHFVVDRESIWIAPGHAETVLGSAELMLELLDLARGWGVKPSHETLEQLRSASAACVVPPEACRRFLRILGDPSGLGHLLRNLHRVGLLSRLVSAFEHARCLIQFNEYHNYTVDEHSIRAVEAAARRSDDNSPLGQACREVRRKSILHLALLVHDLGKGLGEDHSEVGREIAGRIAETLGLSEHDRELLVFLVHQHLLMPTVAFRRDTADAATIIQFARTVGTPEVLRMMYVMAASDIEAVAPGTWTPWKESLLTGLYMATMRELTGEAPVADEAARADAIRAELLADLHTQFAAEWVRGQLEAFPLSYLQTHEPAAVAEHLRVLQQFEPGGVFVASQYMADTGLCQYTIFTHDTPKPGLFARIAGVLAAGRFSIMSARLVTRSDGIVLDTFIGRDLDFTGEPPAERRTEIAERIEDVLLGRRTVEELFARRGRSLAVPKRPLPGPPPQVLIDNDSSDRYTIIEVFADDRLGLLYNIARTLVELGLSVHSAKISTRLDQIADAFYVTTEGGAKITTEEQIHETRDHLLAAILVGDTARP